MRAMLARREALRTVARHGTTCAPELRAPCVVWDWLSAAEAADVERHGMSSPLVVRAWRRWQEARRTYAERAGASEAAACGPTGRPTLNRP